MIVFVSATIQLREQPLALNSVNSVSPNVSIKQIALMSEHDKFQDRHNNVAISKFTRLVLAAL